MVSGNKNKKEKNIRIVATCADEYTFNPFFINMNELPQINANAMSRMIGKYCFCLSIFFNAANLNKSNSIDSIYFYIFKR